MSPFKRYFHKWKEGDESLYNILTALDGPVIDDKDDPVRIALERLKKRCAAVCDRIKEYPDENITHPELKKPFVRKKVVLIPYLPPLLS